MTRVFEHPPFPDYALVDSGGGAKLERFGELVLARPDPQALWRPRLLSDEWARRADLTFVRESDRGGRWEGRGSERDEWRVAFGEARLLVRPTRFKHVGLFPEQASNWVFLRARAAELGGRPRVLNLFGYTGAASVVAAQVGCAVTHVDASRSAIAWARANAAASGLPPRALRVVLEDALTFARREVGRGSRYAGVLVDPPHYGRGPKGEKWQLEEHLAPLFEACAELLEPRAFLVLSTYAVGYSPLAFQNLLDELGTGRSEVGELALPEEPLRGRPARLLPCGFCARWSRGTAWAEA